MTSLTGSRGPTGGNIGQTATGKWTGDKLPSGYKTKQLANFTPEQMDLFQQLFGLASPDSFLSQLAGGDSSAFDQVERPALRQFNALQGNLASRFSGMGMGARRSSGFQNTANQQGSDFAQQLQSQRQGLQRQALMDLMGISDTLLNKKPFDRFLVEKPQKNNWNSLIGAGIGGLGGFALGGPTGAMQGAQLGYGVGSAF